MANFNSESYHSLIGFLPPEYLGFLKLNVVPRFTGTCMSPVPVNRGILTSLISHSFAILFLPLEHKIYISSQLSSLVSTIFHPANWPDVILLNGYVTNPNPTPTLTPNRNPNSKPNPNLNQINKKIQRKKRL
jgi:hypothetical protein